MIFTQKNKNDALSKTLVLGFFLLFSIKLPSSVVNAESLCQANEKVYFNCNMVIKKSNKTVSLCGSEDITKASATLQYRFGKPEAIELQQPQVPTEFRSFFRYFRYTRFQVSRTEISFQNKGTHYILFDDFEGDINPVLRERGVDITLSDKKSSNFVFKCSESIFSDLTSLENHIICDIDKNNMANCLSPSRK